MNKQELQKVWKHFTKTKNAKDKQKLVEHYYNSLVKGIAANLAKKIKYKICADELASYGVLGLYRVLDSYTPGIGVQFETYAFARVWGSMLDEIRKNDWVPRSVRIKQNALEKIRIKLEAKYGRKAEENEILKVAKISEPEYNKLHKQYNPSSCVSLENNINNDNEYDNKEFNKYLEDKTLPSLDSKLVRKEFLKKILGENLSRLERQIIYYYYYEQLTMKEISKIIKVSESRVSQMHQDILKILKKRVSSDPEYFSQDIQEAISGCNDGKSLLK